MGILSEELRKWLEENDAHKPGPSGTSTQPEPSAKPGVTSMKVNGCFALPIDYPFRPDSNAN